MQSLSVCVFRVQIKHQQNHLADMGWLSMGSGHPKLPRPPVPQRLQKPHPHPG